MSPPRCQHVPSHGSGATELLQIGSLFARTAVCTVRAEPIQVEVVLGRMNENRVSSYTGVSLESGSSMSIDLSSSAAEEVNIDQRVAKSQTQVHCDQQEQKYASASSASTWDDLWGSASYADKHRTPPQHQQQQQTLQTQGQQQEDQQVLPTVENDGLEDQIDSADKRRAWAENWGVAGHRATSGAEERPVEVRADEAACLPHIVDLRESEREVQKTGIENPADDLAAEVTMTPVVHLRQSV